MTTRHDTSDNVLPPFLSVKLQPHNPHGIAEIEFLESLGYGIHAYVVKVRLTRKIFGLNEIRLADNLSRNGGSG